ncbi:MAG: formylglycine-generating enzyme family protein [Planctomycetes bacterium]|nr:formylglycine-generating enzyme family protein [Planctomycetota bacterium]
MKIASASTCLVLLAPLSLAQGPTTYCTAGASTNFCFAQISANTQPNPANVAGCVITTSGLPGNRQGQVFYGIDNSGFTPTAWGGSFASSFLCVKAPTKRLGASLNSGGTAGLCNGTFVVDWDAFQAANPTALGNPWAFGDKVFVQSWYRDPLAAKTSNLSNALELTMDSSVIPCATSVPGLVLIPAGTFQMGSGAAGGPPYFGDPTLDGPVHQVTLSYCFWMGETEVTQAQYSALMGANPSYYPGANQPVETVSWFDAQAYCAALTTQQSALGNVPPGYQYRLPTEAEWEYACRAGTPTEFNVGDALFCNQAMFRYSVHSDTYCWSGPGLNFTPGPSAVRSYAPNPWGLYDMHGNVAEWCIDFPAPYSAAPVTDPFVPAGTAAIVRGGGWGEPSHDCRSGNRAFTTPTFPSASIGFRVVLAPVVTP